MTKRRLDGDTLGLGVGGVPEAAFLLPYLLIPGLIRLGGNFGQL